MKGCSLLCRNIGIVYAYTMHTLIGNIFLLLSPELWAAISDVSKMHSMKMERKWPFTETRQTLLLPAAQANIIRDKACYGRTLERVWWECLFTPMVFLPKAHVCVRKGSVMSDFLQPIDYSPPGSSIHMGFSRQEYWGGLLCPPLGDLPDPGIKPVSLISYTLAGRFFTTSTTWKAPSLQ